MIDPAEIQNFQKDGYAVVRRLFSEREVDFYRRHYMTLRHQGQYKDDFAGVKSSDEEINRADPLQKYPRMIHMHRWDEISLRWMLDDRLRQYLNAFLGRDPYAVQTMLYFKPPGARGQALHQDQYYLRAHPGTCVAAWLALDPCDESNGCLEIVPDTAPLPIMCTIQADTTQSFTDVAVPLAEGMTPIPMIMDPGDVLFFNGTLIHGSFPNTTSDRFRRSLIAHYVSGEAEQLTQYDQPVLTMDGEEKWLEFSKFGGACGVWIEQNGRATYQIVNQEEAEFDEEELIPQ